MVVLAKKSFGQHFLRDASVVHAILDAARPEDFSLIVEVGPGQGALTEAIDTRRKTKDASGELVLLEADKDLIASVSGRFPHARVIQTDAAKFDYSRLAFCVSGLPWLLVGNLPFNAANAIIMDALESPTPPSRMVVMVQKEVGERLLGLPGCRGLLTVAVGLHATVERVCTVKPGAFVPPPKVDSMVVKITPAPNPSPLISTKDIIAVAKAGFANRRKQLHGNLAEAGVASSDVTKRALVSFGLPPTARAEELSIEQWRSLAEQLL